MTRRVKGICSVENCGRPNFGQGCARGYCSKCYQMWRTYGRTTRTTAERGEGSINKYTGYRETYRLDGRKTYEHIQIAEKALGRPLPVGAVVHHVTENKADNHGPFKLIICPDAGYHMHIHKLMRAKGISFKTGWPNEELLKADS